MLVAVCVAGCSGDVVTSTSCPGGDRSGCVKELAVGGHFGCALLLDGKTWCWGRNDENQLGYATTDLCTEDLSGNQTQSVACHTFPFQARSVTKVAHVVTGDAFACILGGDGTVSCWGANDAGQLGNGSTVPSLTPVPVGGLSGVTRLALGARHACAIAGGAVHCWGANEALQSAPTSSQHCGSIDCNPSAVTIAAITNATEIAAGAAHTCARTDDGHVLCWGDNSLGELGIGAASAMPSAMPAKVVTSTGVLDGVSSLAAGTSHTCALRSDGEVFCWGRDDLNQLGVAPPAMTPDKCTAPCSVVAVYVDGIPGEPAEHNFFMQVDAGAPQDMSAPPIDASVPPVLVDGGADAAMAPRPDLAIVLTAPKAIVSGADFACALLGDGTVACWGVNADGEIGAGETSMPRMPTRVIAGPGAARDNPLTNIIGLGAGGVSACALATSGSARCWGSNRDGALGIGNTLPQSGPVPLSW